MNVAIQRLCIWTGIAGIVVQFTGLWPLLHFIPPPMPSATAAEIAGMYREHAVPIIMGSILMLSSAAMLVPFYAAISAQMEVMEAKGAPLAKAQLMLALLAVCVPVAVTAVLWMVAAYRPERSDETIQLLNDIGWVLFFSPVVAGLVQVFVIAAAILTDRSPVPVFPRWFAFLNIWVGILFLPGGILALFKTGPFAWNGLLCFWLGIGAFGVWFVPMAWLLLKAAREPAESAAQRIRSVMQGSRA
jgi:hypothetical protein